MTSTGNETLAGGTRWGKSLGTLGFRWIGVYLLVYVLPWVPGAAPIRAPIRAITLWVVHRVADPAYQPPSVTGSGDTLLDWFQVPVLATFAAVVVAVWAAVDRCRGDGRLTRWAVWVVCRYFLAMVMVSYGMAKVLPIQFAEPGPTILSSTYADSSPMGLLWRFMGYSGPYTMFAGLAEVIGGLLLLSRRTVTLGAMMLAGVLANVVMLNVSYDVPVKLFSSHLLLMACGVALADWRRLWSVFASGRAVPPRDLSPPFLDRRALRVALVVKVLAALYVLRIVLSGISYDPPPRDRPELYGIHQLETDDRSPDAWTRVVIEWSTRLAVWTKSGERIIYNYGFDGEHLVMHERDGHSSYRFRVARPSSEVLELHGEGTVLRLGYRDPEDVLLKSRRFRWVSEYPFGR